MSPSLPLFPEPMVKIWSSRSLHAPCSYALQGTVAKAFLPWPPWPLAPCPPVLPCPPWLVLFPRPMSSEILCILFSWDLSGSSFCTVLLTALLYKLKVHRKCWTKSTPSCLFVVNISVGRVALPGNSLIVILAFTSFTVFYLSFYKLWGEKHGEMQNKTWWCCAHQFWVRILILETCVSQIVLLDMNPNSWERAIGSKKEPFFVVVLCGLAFWSGKQVQVYLKIQVFWGSSLVAGLTPIWCKQQLDSCVSTCTSVVRVRVLCCYFQVDFLILETKFNTRECLLGWRTSIQPPTYPSGDSGFKSWAELLCPIGPTVRCLTMELIHSPCWSDYHWYNPPDHTSAYYSYVDPSVPCRVLA